MLFSLGDLTAKRTLVFHLNQRAEHTVNKGTEKAQADTMKNSLIPYPTKPSAYATDEMRKAPTREAKVPSSDMPPLIPLSHFLRLKGS